MNFLTHPWLQLLLAVGIASVLGSLHCVGMCGPFALWASAGAGSKRELSSRIALYHTGRLITYLVGGAVAGIAGAAIAASGSWLGVQAMAARVAGGMMIALALVRLVKWIRPRTTRRTQNKPLPEAQMARGGLVAGWLAGLRPAIQRLPVSLRALATGTLTTLLPCGWLYLFLIVAGGTGSLTSALTVMFAFWLGSLPALTSLMVGVFGFTPKIRPALPILGTVLLLITGLYTATGRAAADMTILTERVEAIRKDSVESGEHGNVAQASEHALDELSEAPLPCCSSDQ